MIRSLIAISVKRRVSVLMVTTAVVAFGLLGLSRLALNLLPDIAYPTLSVQTEFLNAAPGEVENLITKPVEENVGVLKGLREMHSVSRSGMSEVVLEFGWGANMDVLAMDIREKLDRVILPDEAEKPIVLRYDPSQDPIMRLALSGNDDMVLLRYLADKEIKDELEKIDGVAAARIKGGEEEEIHIDLEQGKVAAIGISPEQLATTLAAANINRPGGSLKGTDNQFLVRTLNEFKSVREISDISITPLGRPPVRLGDVANVERGVKDREEITRVNGRECVILEIFKEGDENTVRVASAVEKKLDELRHKLPKDGRLDVIFDQSHFIEQAVNEVRDALLFGGLLAIIVLFLFLRDYRATLIIATSIPISVIATFVVMYYLDLSLNIMSLGGLTLGIGMLVDASIVVLESIARKRELGYSRFRAAVDGTHEVGGAVIASVLTTVAVFFPIVFVEGIAGQLFRDQALTVTFSLLASLLVSLSLIPMLAGIGKSGPSVGEVSTKIHDEFSNESLEESRKSFFVRLYEPFLLGALRMRSLTLLIAFAIFGASLLLVPKLGSELIPELRQGEFFFEVTMPEGTSLPATDRTLRQMEDEAQKRPDVERVYSSVGTRSVSGGLSLKTKDENLGQINVVMKDRRDEKAEIQAAAALRESYERVPSLATKLGRPSFFTLKTAVEVQFYSENLQDLRDYTERLTPALKQVKGLSEVRTSLEVGNPELNVVFDREKLAHLGLTTGDVSQTLNSRVSGTVVSQFKDGDRQIDIRMRNREADRDSVSAIEDLVVSDRNGTPISLKAVASVELARGPAEIHRIKQSRVAILSADLAGRPLDEVIKDARAVIAANPPPPGISFQFAGQNEEMQHSISSLRFMLLLAIFLVYLVMAATFENMVHPLLILFTIPLALVGAIVGLYLSGHPISVIAMLGVVLLAGIVVNNAIVLVDAINRGRRAGLLKRTAVIHACKIRLRPILMTTLTTVLGLLPMAFGLGEGAELRQPLAIVVSAGLALSTLLTLVVIPAAYDLIPTRVRTLAEDEELERVVAEADQLEGLGA